MRHPVIFLGISCALGGYFARVSQPKPPTARHVRDALRAAKDPARALSSARFFKTGEGQYGEGDRFLSVTVPAQRVIARAHRGLPLPEVEALIASPMHEERLTALLILVDAYARGDEAARQACCALYLANLAWVKKDAFEIVTLLLDDEEDLKHKAVGWMLREVGKHAGEEPLRVFPRGRATAMPRTALRYAIERFPAEERALWLAMKRKPTGRRERAPRA